MNLRQKLLQIIGGIGTHEIRARRLMYKVISAEKVGVRIVALPFAVCARVDMWLCRSLGRLLCRIVLWLDGREIPEDEFHHSLDINGLLTTWMTPEEFVAYLADLARRRDIAHRRDFARMDAR